MKCPNAKLLSVICIILTYPVDRKGFQKQKPTARSQQIDNGQFYSQGFYFKFSSIIFADRCEVNLTKERY